MTWQDELRRLESDLAAGRVSAQDYRIRRDQLLTSAAAPQQEGSSEQQAPPDSTQVIPQVTDADATQAVQRPRQHEIPRGGNFPQHGASQQAFGGHQGYAPPPGFGQQTAFDQDPERTQTVSPGARERQQQEEDPPPWAGNEFPPVATGSSEWAKHGPEAFGEDGKGSTGKILAVIGGVVLVALLAVGTFLLFGKDSEGGRQPQAGGGADRNNNQQVKPKRGELGLVAPPGDQENHSEVQDLDGLKAANYLTPPETQAYVNAVPAKVVFKVGRKGETTTVVVGARASSPSSAKTAAKALNEAQLTNGMTASRRDQPKGVYVAEVREGSESKEMRAHYAHGTTIVRVHVSGPDYRAVKQNFDKALGDELNALSADG